MLRQYVEWLNGCVLSNNKVIRQKDRGSSEAKSYKIYGIKLRVNKWFDNCAVTIVTTYEATQSSTKVKMWD